MMCTVCREIYSMDDAIRKEVLGKIMQSIQQLPIDTQKATEKRLQDLCLNCLRFNLSEARRDTPRPTFRVLDGLDFEKVKKIFAQTMSNYLILRIEENLNCPSRASDSTLMFHGSAHRNYDHIAHEGFRIDLSRDGMLGRGIYLADDASYSHSYTQEVLFKNDTYYNMFVCDVTLRPENHRRSGNIVCVTDEHVVNPRYVVYYRGD